MNGNKFPQYLSAPLQIMWFEADDFVIIILSIVIFLILGGWSIIVSIVLPVAFIQLKKNYSSSFLKHMIYFTGFKNLEYYPIAFEDEFHE